jgi:hypothetical protein
MHIRYQIVQNSAIGPYPKLYQYTVIGLFMVITIILMAMLFVLLRYGSHVTIHFGY